MSTDDHHCCNVEEEPLRNDPVPAPSEQPPSSEPVQPPQRESCLEDVLLIILSVFFLVFTLVVWLLVGFNLINILEDTSSSASANGRDQEFYGRVKKVEAATKEFAKRAKIIHSRLVILVLTWLIVNLGVDPGLKNKLVLGSELWKWSLLVALILCGYSFISLASSSLLKLLCLSSKFTRDPNAEYYARGLRRSANLVVLTSSVLLTWIFYFKTSHGIRKTPKTRELDRVGTWTFITLAVAALLWLLKNVLLLMWEANVVYNRFTERILGVRLHQFFLGHMCDYEDRQRLDVFQPKVPSSSSDGIRVSDERHPTVTRDETQPTTASNERQPTTTSDEKQPTAASDERQPTAVSDEKHPTPASDERQPTTASDARQLTTFDIQRMAEYFIVLSVASSRDDDGTSQVLTKCKQFLNTGVNKKDITANDLSKLLKLGDGEDNANLGEKYAGLLLSDLKREYPKEKELEKITYEKWSMSMVKAQKNCLALGYSLSDAKDVVKLLDKVMTALLVAIVIVAWLLLTDIATNKILVLIASPFLAATFIFGEACKKIFEGIVFSFINHPFNVGDLCIIDDKELEVKRMGILTTKFILIGKKEEVLYPNSILATKSIINLREEPNPKDHVELKLPNSIIGTQKYTNLEDKIKRYLKKAKTSLEAITLEDIGDGTKIAIRYQLRLGVKSVTHSQCLKKKRKRKSELLKEITKFLEEDVGVVVVATDPPPVAASKINMTSEIKPSNT